MPKLNFKELEKFAEKLNKLKPEHTARFTETAVKELAARLLRKAVLRTPVGEYPKSTGKKGGTLRRGWTVGEVKKTDGGYTVEIINPTEYASYVEYGHRTRNRTGWVEGRFMMSVSAEELERDAPRIIKQKLKAFLEGALK